MCLPVLISFFFLLLLWCNFPAPTSLCGQLAMVSVVLGHRLANSRPMEAVRGSWRRCSTHRGKMDRGTERASPRTCRNCFSYTSMHSVRAILPETSQEFSSLFLRASPGLKLLMQLCEHPAVLKGIQGIERKTRFYWAHFFNMHVAFLH
jgi:hypothetical protein